MTAVPLLAQGRARLNGRVPVEWMAGLGLLAAAEHGRRLRQRRGAQWVMRWEQVHQLRAEPVLSGPRGLDRLADDLAADLEYWAGAAALDVQPQLVLSPIQASEWIGRVLEAADLGDSDDGEQLHMLAGLIDPDVTRTTRIGRVWRSPLIFTSGQQQFLASVAAIRQAVTPELLAARLRPDQQPVRVAGCPGLRWEFRANRTGAKSGFAPARDPQPGDPALEWLAFRALAVLRVDGFARRDRMQWRLWLSPRTLHEARAWTSGRVTAADTVQGWSVPIVRDDHNFGHFGGPDLPDEPAADDDDRTWMLALQSAVYRRALAEDERDELIRAALATGLSATKIALAADISRGRVYQIRDEGPDVGEGWIGPTMPPAH